LLSLLPLVGACPSDDSDDDAGEDSANATSAADDTATSNAESTAATSGPDDDGGSGADDANTTAPADDGGEGSCVEAGGACTELDYCGSWNCLCLNSGTEFMTIGSCNDGTCSTDGNEVCEGICTPNGGVMTATDLGCE
jgi:hypothetical protein